MKNDIVRVLMYRDGMTLDDAKKKLSEARNAVIHGQDPVEVLLNNFGLERDYIWDLLSYKVKKVNN